MKNIERMWNKSMIGIDNLSIDEKIIDHIIVSVDSEVINQKIIRTLVIKLKDGKEHYRPIKLNQL